MQRNLFSASPSLLDLSCKPARAAGSNTFVECLMGRTSADMQAAARIWSEEVLPLLETDRTAIISSEDLAVQCNTPESLFQRIAMLAPKAEIVAVVRDQVGLIRSLYDMYPTTDENRATGKATPLAKYLDWAFGENAAWFDRLKFAQTLAPAVAMFGRERVHIFSYERLFGEESEDRTRFAELMGVNIKELNATIEAPPENQFELHAARRMMRRLLGPIHASWFLPLPAIRAVKVRIARSLKFQRTILSDAATSRIRSYYDADNSALLACFPEIRSL